MTVQNSRPQAAIMLFLMGVFVSAATHSQSIDKEIPHLPNGQPDIQGTWDFRTISPFQRPESLAGKEVLSETEAIAFQAAENERRDRDNFTDTSTTGDYNQFWYDRGTSPRRACRT